MRHEMRHEFGAKSRAWQMWRFGAKSRVWPVGEIGTGLVPKRVWYQMVQMCTNGATCGHLLHEWVHFRAKACGHTTSVHFWGKRLLVLHSNE